MNESEENKDKPEVTALDILNSDEDDSTKARKIYEMCKNDQNHEFTFEEFFDDHKSDRDFDKNMETLFNKGIELDRAVDILNLMRQITYNFRLFRKSVNEYVNLLNE